MIRLLNYIIGALDLTKLYPLARRFLGIKGRHRVIRGSCDYTVKRDGLSVPVRYYPAEAGSDIIMFIHGGGWATESVDTYDSICRAVVRDVRCSVISVGYSLAPEHKFPDALNECCAVYRELRDRAAVFGITPDRIFLCGDSAGGNLAMSLSLLLRDRGEGAPSKQILLYPVAGTDYTALSPFRSVKEKGVGYTLTARHMRDYVRLYMRDETDLLSPYFSPLNAAHYYGLPETLIFTAENDPLCSEGEELGRRILKSGVRTEIYRVRGAAHGFFADVKCCRAHRVRGIIREFILR